jgi:lipoyl(octanoyl) transferase
LNTIELIQPGLTDFTETWKLQQKLYDEVLSKRSRNFLILTEHHPVITIGKSGSTQNLLADKSFLESNGIGVVNIDRGGDITFHGPGQIVGYPVLNLSAFKEDVNWYLRQLENIIIDTLADFQIESSRISGLTGVWVGNNKICAIGVKVTRWVTMHGFALNLSTNLKFFDYIIPCGIQDKGITSILSELGNNPGKNLVINSLCTNIEKIFNVKIIDS